MFKIFIPVLYLELFVYFQNCISAARSFFLSLGTNLGISFSGLLLFLVSIYSKITYLVITTYDLPREKPTSLKY